MRWLVVALIVLAGCAEAPVPVLEGPDPTVPIYGGINPESLHLLGSDNNETGDARVLVGRCASQQNVFAYTFPARLDNASASRVVLTFSHDVPNATSFLIASFADSPGGLIPTRLVAGGAHASEAPPSMGQVEWYEAMPRSFTIPVGPDGMVRIAIACEGEGVVNYVIDEPTNPERPDYLEPVVASGFDAFLADGYSLLYVPLPPNTRITGPAWTLVGDVIVDYSQTAPNGVRVGETHIQWGSSRAGWTTTMCGHDGWAETGTWAYEADFGHGPESAGGLIVDSIATLGLSQMLLFGDMVLSHSGSGGEAPWFRFSVEHQASSEVAWSTWCVGTHLGAPLDVLFAAAGAREWDMPEPFL